ncbi:hypothetical protein HK100_007038, partial [Physocladia obscura]
RDKKKLTKKIRRLQTQMSSVRSEQLSGPSAVPIAAHPHPRTDYPQQWHQSRSNLVGSVATETTAATEAKTTSTDLQEQQRLAQNRIAQRAHQLRVKNKILVLELKVHDLLELRKQRGICVSPAAASATAATANNLIPKKPVPSGPHGNLKELPFDDLSAIKDLPAVERRALQNRISQRALRQRRKDRIYELETRVAELSLELGIFSIPPINTNNTIVCNNYIVSATATLEQYNKNCTTKEYDLEPGLNKEKRATWENASYLSPKKEETRNDGFWGLPTRLPPVSALAAPSVVPRTMPPYSQYSGNSGVPVTHQPLQQPAILNSYFYQPPIRNDTPPTRSTQYHPYQRPELHPESHVSSNGSHVTNIESRISQYSPLSQPSKSPEFPYNQYSQQIILPPPFSECAARLPRYNDVFSSAALPQKFQNSTVLPSLRDMLQGK